MSIESNVKKVLETVADAAVRSGRKPEDITVIGVTKTVGPESVIEMARAGITVAGENRVQELLSKREALSDALPGLRWHMIGHLQTNKVKQVINAVDMIHSVDSIRLAEAIDKCAGVMGKVMDVLLEINIAKESSKYGFFPEEVMDAYEILHKFSHLNVRGLMCVAPIVENSLENRPFFEKMRKISIDINDKLSDNRNRVDKMDVLSMGMTLDYPVAILEGATMVRVGTAVFGDRK